MKRDVAIIAAAIAVILAIVIIRTGMFSGAADNKDAPAGLVSTETPSADPSILKRPGATAESTGGILRRPGQGDESGGVLKRPAESGGGAAEPQRPVRR